MLQQEVSAVFEGIFGLLRAEGERVTLEFKEKKLVICIRVSNTSDSGTDAPRGRTLRQILSRWCKVVGDPTLYVFVLFRTVCIAYVIVHRDLQFTCRLPSFSLSVSTKSVRCEAWTGIAASVRCWLPAKMSPWMVDI